MVLLYLFITAFFVLLYFIYRVSTKNYNYWKKKNVAHLKPVPFFGNYMDYILFKKYGPQVTQQICRKFPREPYVGVYYGTDPALVLQDPEMIKLVMSKDFYYFNGREINDYTHREVITQNMFFSGGDRWRVVRQNVTTLFSSGKIKKMFYLIKNCANALDQMLNEEIKTKEILEIRSILARYTMDCIGNCSFGIDTCTLTNNSSNNPFTIMGEKLFDISNYGGFRLLCRSMWPAFFYKLKLQLFEDEILFFFKKLITDVFVSRQYQESSRHDFVDLILTWKKNNCIIGSSIRDMKTGDKTTMKLEVDDNLMIIQCILFFAAGFETTASTISHTLFELSKNKEAQSRVLEEVDAYLRRHDGDIEYECINELPYLHACIDEALRLYPVLGVLTREVEEEYTFPTGLTLEKGARIHIPLYHLQRNPEHFPEPDEFRPERFYGENKKNIKPFTYIPFGEGPRICVGLRFSKMPTVAGLLTVLKKYRVELADTMPKTLTLEPRAFVTQPVGGIHLKFIPRLLVA